MSGSAFLATDLCDGPQMLSSEHTNHVPSGTTSVSMYQIRLTQRHALRLYVVCGQSETAHNGVTKTWIQPFRAELHTVSMR